MTNIFTKNLYFLLRCLIISCILFLGFYQSNAQITIGNKVDYKEPQKYRIAGISVIGAVYSDVQAIKLVSGLQDGQLVMIPGDDISEAIRKLWKQKLFTDISISVAEFRGEDVFLLIQLKEMPRLGKYRIEGLRKSETDNVREKIDLRTGVVCNENLKAIAINKIQDYYLEKGFYNCVVSLREEPDPLMQNSVVLIFDVNRGNRMKIEYIELDGVNKIPAKKIYRSMKNTKKRKWWNVFKSSKFIEDKYQEDKDKIIERYNKEGFRNAKIVSDSVFTMNSERLAIKMKIEEGNKFYFRNIKFVGNVKYRTSSLDSVLNIQKGDIYNVELLQNRLNYNPAGLDVSSLYTDDGYLTFYAYPVETLIEPDSIDVEIRMSEGKQFRIGKISVIGNTKTNDHVIFREIRTRPGELFNRTDIIRTQRELANLGYFDPAAFDVHTIPREEEGLVDLEYVVEEKPSDQIQLSGGWGGQRIVGSLSLNFSNFSMRNIFKPGAWSPLPTGDGQRFSISASSNGLFYRSFNASFTEPWFGGKKPNSLTFSAWNSRQTNGIREKDATTVNPYQRLEIMGGSVSFGKRLQKPDDYFLLYTGLSYQHFSLNNYGSFFSFKNGTSNNLAVNFTLERNSVSEPIYPVSGSKINFTTKLTPPIKQIREIFGAKFDYPNLTDAQKFDWVEYYKLKFTAHWYTALNKHKERKFVLHTNVGVGFLGTYNSKLGQSPFERFYLGGVYLSGFLLDGREIVNLRGYDDLSLTTPNQNVGAPVISKYGMELRYPLSTNPQATIYALTFIEAARTWTNFKDYNPFNLYRSAGAGLRIFLPMFGLLGFDYGWRLDDVPNAPSMARSQFHFSIGMNLGEL
jgi:outer membrane protein insertion porin family